MKKIKIKEGKDKLKEFNPQRQYASGAVNTFIDRAQYISEEIFDSFARYIESEMRKTDSEERYTRLYPNDVDACFARFCTKLKELMKKEEEE